MKLRLFAIMLTAALVLGVAPELLSGMFSLS